MIDKVDLRVPAETDFGPVLRNLIPDLDKGPLGPFRPSRFYTHVGDLREQYNLDAVVHLGYKYREHTHKIEIIDAGKKTLDDMRDVVASLFVVNPDDLELMRVDLAADISGVPVNWFREHARFLYKQFSSRIEKAKESELEFVSMGNAEAQSLYAGKRPNCIRIYDKYSELVRQWRKIVNDYERFNDGMKKFSMNAEQQYYGERVPPTFEQFCHWEGFRYTDGDILTRVERQIGGDRFPPELQTFGDLRRAASFNPYSSIRILKTARSSTSVSYPSSMASRDILMVKGYLALSEELGSAQEVAALIYKHGNGNGKRILDSVMKKLPDERQPVTPEEIYEQYRKSTLPQIVVTSSTRRGVYLPPRNEKENKASEGSPGILPETWESRRTEKSGPAFPGTT